MNNFQAYKALAERLGCGSMPLLPSRVDAMYGMAQSEDNRASVLHRLEANFVCGMSDQVLLLGEDACSGFSGFHQWKDYLLSRPHVPHHVITGVRGSTYVDTKGVVRVHSGTESTAAVKYCLEQRINSLVVVAPEFHIARTFAHFVTAALAHAPHMNIWPMVGEELPWDEVVVHSQGEQQATREEIASAEYQKIFTYKEIAPIEEIVAYIRLRDQRTTT